MRPNYLGLVLAGGQSRRMGQDKALLPFGDVTLFEHVLHRFVRQIDTILISTVSDHPVFTRCGWPLIRDLAPFERLGPLSGLNAAFHYCQNLESPSLYKGIITIAVDTPFFPDDYVARLCDAAALKPQSALIATTSERTHPTFALWPLVREQFPKSVKRFSEKNCGKNKKLEQMVRPSETKTALATALRQHLESGQYSLLSFAAQVRAEHVVFADEDSFFNINKQQEWELARDKLAMLRKIDGKRTN